MSQPVSSAEAVSVATAKAPAWPAVVKLAVALYLPVALGLTALTYGLLRVDADARLQNLQAQETAEVSVAEQLLIHDFEYATSDLQFLAQTTALKRFVNDAKPAEKQRITEHFISLLQTKQRYDRVRYFDLNGAERIRVNLSDRHAVAVAKSALQDRADSYFFREALRLSAGELYVSPLDLSTEHGRIELPYKPTLRFGTPLFDRAGRKQGVLMLNYYGQELLDDFAQAMGTGHHAMLVNRDGYWLRGPDAAREWGFMFGRDDTFGKYYPDAWAAISTAQQGSVVTREGLYTFTTVRPLLAAEHTQPPATGAGNSGAGSELARNYYWKIVSLVPAAELPAVSASQYPRSFALFGAGLLLLALVALYLAANILSRRQLRAAVLENAAHLKEITATLGEGIYVVDQRGLTTFINPEAERLLGLTQAELIGQHAHNQFHYRAADGTPIHADDCEIHRVMQSGKTYRSNTQVFWRKDGSCLHVEVNAAPIVRDGKISGAVVAFSDIGERFAAQEALRSSVETSRALLNATTESAILIDVNGIVLSINKVGAKRLHKQASQIIGHSFFDLVPADVAARWQKLLDEVMHSGLPRLAQDEHGGIYLDLSLYPIADAQGKVSHIAIYSADITERIKLQAEETLLHHIDLQVLRSSSLSVLLQFVCDEVVQLFGYPFVLLGKKESGGAFSISAHSGNASAYLAELRRVGVRWDDTPQGKGPAGSCIRSGQMQVFKISDGSFLPWRDAAAHFEFQSIVGIPLIVRGEVYGALMLYSQFEHDFDDSVTQQRIAGIASRICVALEMAMDHEQLRLLSTALASAGNGVFITDRQGRILWVNNSFTRLTGYSSDEAIGRLPSLFKSGVQDDAYYRLLWQTILQGKTWSSETVERHKTGMLFTVQQTITPIADDDGVVSHFVSIIDDITAQKEIAAHIQHMAHFDALTALPNRALFHDRLRLALAQARRDGESCALMFLDLDRFKEVNDTLGHHVGDLLLQAVAGRLKSCVREADTVSRLSGDEFTVLLPHVHSREDAGLIAAKITSALAAPFTLDGHEVSIGSSTGIAFYPADAASDDALIKCADRAMYAAKEQGRGTFSFYQAAL